jgi:hypothetical protein
VGFEGLNGLLSSIATMYVRRDKLVPNLPVVHNGGLEFGTDFIVKDLKINIVSMVGKAVHDGVVGGQLVFIGPVDIRGAEDCIAAAVESNNDVLVAAAHPDGESPCVVGVEPGKQEVRDVELISGGQCGGLVTEIFWFVSGWCIRRGKWCTAI